MKKLNYYMSVLFVLCGICVLVFAKDSTQINKQDNAIKNSESLPLQNVSLESLFDNLTNITWQIYTLHTSNDLEKKEKLVDKKKILLQYFIRDIADSKKSIGFEINNNMLLELETKISESKIQNNPFDVLENEIAKHNLIIKSNLLTLFKNLRSQINFFSQQQKIIDVIHPTLNIFNTMPTTFEIPKEITEKQNKELQLQIDKYRNTLATAIELVSYLEWNASTFIPQNTILHTCMRWTLQIIGGFIDIDNNLNMIKSMLSILCFVLLWACRKIITNIVVYIMDIIIYLAKQDKELHFILQKNLLRPISLFLLVWSFQVCAGVLYYPNLQPERIDVWFIILYIINISWFIIALVQSYGTLLLTKILQKTNNEFRKEIINLILKALYSIIIIITCLLILKYLGFNISAIIASLGLGGLAVALAVKDILANFFASVMLLFDNSFSQGDWIECGGVDGVVVEIGLRRTTVRTTDNALMFVPNSELAGKIIRNWSRRKSGRRIKMSIGVTYDANEEKLKQCVAAIKQMLSKHPEINVTSNYSQDEIQLVSLRKDIISIDDFLGYKSGFSVCVESLSDSSINILVDCFTKSVSKKDFFEVREDVIFKIMAIVQECNLSFAFPSQSVYIETLPNQNQIS